MEHGLGIFAVGHLFLGEGGTEDYFRKDVEPPVRHKAAVDDEAMKTWVEVDEITEGLDGDDGARYAFRRVQGRMEKLFTPRRMA